MNTKKIKELIESIKPNSANLDYIKSKNKINGSLYQDIKRIIIEYCESERQKSTDNSESTNNKALHIADVIGRLSINDIEVFHYSVRIPKITENNFSEKMCRIFENKLSEKLSGLDYANVEENGIMVIGFRNMMITKKQEDIIVSVFNDL